MAQTITPVVHGGRRGRWIGSVAAHAIGATASAAALGAVLGGAGSVLGAPRGRTGLVVVAVLAVAYAARELLGVPLPLPNLHRQVPEWWRTFFSPPIASLLYGLGLGVGFLTFLSFGTLVAVGGAAFALGDPATGALLVAPFGLARGVSVLVAWPATDERHLDAVTARLDAVALSRAPRLANGIALVSVAAAATAAAVHSSVATGSALPAIGLGAVFAWAAIAKLIDPRSWGEALDAYRLDVLHGPALIGVPLAELAVPVTVAAGAPRVGAGVAIGLLVVFSLAVLRARRFTGDRIACGCFGRTRSRDFRAILLRNGALAVLGVVALLERARPPGLHLPGHSEVLPSALAAGGVTLLFVLVRASVRLLTPPRRHGA